MGTTTVKRTSFCSTKETQRQIDDLKERLGENTSQVVTRAIQMLHYSLRFPNLPLKELASKQED